MKQDSNGDLVSKRDEFTFMMKNFLNASAFDVFTIIPSGSVEDPSTDIRFVPKKIPKNKSHEVPSFVLWENLDS